MNDLLRIAVLASGRGSNLNSIIQATQTGKLSAQVALVVSNNSKAGALEIARQARISALHLSVEQFESEALFDRALLDALKKYRVEVIALAGYLKKISPAIVKAFKHRIVNIHPALLPSFGGKGMYGVKVHQAVLDYGCKVSGVTVHLVDEEYDAGIPVLQRCLPVKPDDTAETLAARVLEQEHQIYVEALQLFAEHRIVVRGRKLTLK
ncbi:MAG: phosphoribosylglycinamide formyltransferase [bacterium]